MTVGGAEGKKAPALFDAHCHLDWEADPAAVARACGQRGVALACCTVTPPAFLAARGALAAAPNVVLGVGAHPWWVADGRVGQADVDLAAELAAEVPLVGEVGLDFSPARSDAAGNQAQVRALARICGAAAVGAEGGTAGQRAISLHAVRSAGACLDVLEATGAAARCRCVMHWFSGSSDELGRALRLGCSFSVGERMLATRRGREYARQLPAARLLLETDLPDGAGQGVGADGLLASLDRALTALAQARGVDKDELAATLAANARALADGVCTLGLISDPNRTH